MRYRLHVQPFERAGYREGDGFFSDVLKKGIAQGSRWLKGVLEREGPGAIQRLASAITSPVINTGSNILDKIISWSGQGLRVAGRYGRGNSIAGRGRRRSSSRRSSRSRSRSTSKRRRRKSGGSARSRSRSRSKSRSKSRSRSRSTSSRKSKKGSGTKRKISKTRKRRSPKKKASKGKGMTYRQLKPLLSRNY